jgi:hypothetical protein
MSRNIIFVLNLLFRIRSSKSLSFKLQYEVPPFLFATYGANPLPTVSPDPLHSPFSDIARRSLQRNFILSHMKERVSEVSRAFIPVVVITNMTPSITITPRGFNLLY